MTTQTTQTTTTETCDTCSGCQETSPSIPLNGGSYGAYCEYCRMSALTIIDGVAHINDSHFVFTDQMCCIEDFLSGDKTETQIKEFLRLS